MLFDVIRIRLLKSEEMNMSESLTSELWLKIDQLHLKYLQSEDNPLKLDIRKKLEGS